MVEDNFQRPSPRPSGGSSVLVWVLGIGAVCLVVCCGGFGVMAWRLKSFVADMATSDPAEIRKQTAEMVDITIPEKYTPVQGMNLVVFHMVMYQTDAAADAAADNSRGMLMLMEMTMQQFGVDQQQQEQELRKSMRQQQGNQDFKSSKSETREIEIRGEKVPFEFSEGTAEQQGQEKRIYMVSGVFPGKTRPRHAAAYPSGGRVRRSGRDRDAAIDQVGRSLHRKSRRQAGMPTGQIFVPPFKLGVVISADDCIFVLLIVRDARAPLASGRHDGPPGTGYPQPPVSLWNLADVTSVCIPGR